MSSRPSLGIYLVMGLGIATLSACVTYSEAAFKKQIMAWQGKGEADLIKALGYPQRELKSPSGQRVLEYSSRTVYVEDYMYPSYGRPYGVSPMPRRLREASCTVWFEMSEKKVTQITWRGNQCIAEDEDD